MSSPLETLWTIAFLALWLLIATVHLMSVRWGAIMGITTGRHAVTRKDNPVKFWITWLILSGPFVVLPAFAVIGLFVRK